MKAEDISAMTDDLLTDLDTAYSDKGKYLTRKCLVLLLGEIAEQLAQLNRNIGELTIVLAHPLVKVEPPYDSNVHDHHPFDKRFKRDRS